MVLSIERLMRDPDMASNMSLAAREKALQWSWDKIAPQWNQLLIDAGGK